MWVKVTEDVHKVLQAGGSWKYWPLSDTVVDVQAHAKGFVHALAALAQTLRLGAKRRAYHMDFASKHMPLAVFDLVGNCRRCSCLVMIFVPAVMLFHCWFNVAYFSRFSHGVHKVCWWSCASSMTRLCKMCGVDKSLSL
eukprot:2096683-Amphidinium_carterae.1